MQYLFTTLLAIVLFLPSRAQQSDTSIDYYNKDNNSVPDTVFQNEIKVYQFRQGDIIADTLLPLHTFDKIIIRNTFHHFS